MLPWSAQLELVQAAWTYPQVYREIGGVLKLQHFENPALGQILLTLVSLWQARGVKPTDGQVRAELAKLPALMEASCLSYIVEVQEAPCPDADWAIEKGRSFAAHQETLLFAGELPFLAEQERWLDMQQRMNSITKMASLSGDLTSGLESTEEVIQRQVRTNRSIPVGVYRLDKLIALNRGQVGHVLAKKGGGKSHTLVSFGAYALTLGLRVHHASFEDMVPKVKARYDRSLTGLTSRELIDGGAFTFFESLKDNHSRLTAVDLRGGDVGSIHASLDRLPQGQEPDLVIVDYLQKIRNKSTARGDPASMRRADLVRVSEDVETLAKDRDLGLWTGWQANRAGIMQMRGRDQKLLDVTDYGESYEASYAAAVIVSMNKNLTEEGTEWGKIHVAENRDGPSGATIEAILDWSRSRVRDQIEGEE